MHVTRLYAKEQIEENMEKGEHCATALCFASEAYVDQITSANDIIRKSTHCVQSLRRPEERRHLHHNTANQ